MVRTNITLVKMMIKTSKVEQNKLARNCKVKIELCTSTCFAFKMGVKFASANFRLKKICFNSRGFRHCIIQISTGYLMNNKHTFGRWL